MTPRSVAWRWLEAEDGFLQCAGGPDRDAIAVGGPDDLHADPSEDNEPLFYVAPQMALPAKQPLSR